MKQTLATLALGLTGALAAPLAFTPPAPGPTDTPAGYGEYSNYGAYDDIPAPEKKVSITFTASNTVVSYIDALPDAKSVNLPESGPFRTVWLAPNDNAGLRCQAFNNDGNAARVRRAGLTATSFAEGDQWTFVDDADKEIDVAISHVTCDPALKEPVVLPSPVERPQEEEKDILITFTTSNTVVSYIEAEANAQPTNLPESGPFRTVYLALGANVDPTLRCQAFNNDGDAARVRRGGVSSTSFADGNVEEAWTFVDNDDKKIDVAISHVECNPELAAPVVLPPPVTAPETPAEPAPGSYGTYENYPSTYDSYGVYKKA